MNFYVYVHIIIITVKHCRPCALKLYLMSEELCSLSAAACINRSRWWLASILTHVWFCSTLSAQTGVLQWRARPGGVFYGEGSHSGPHRQRLLLQIQHGERSNRLAKRGTVISEKHKHDMIKQNLLTCPSSFSSPSSSSSFSVVDRDGMFQGTERFWARGVPIPRPRLVSASWEFKTQPAPPDLP